jgi:hypothetical protein
MVVPAPFARSLLSIDNQCLSWALLGLLVRKIKRPLLQNSRAIEYGLQPMPKSRQEGICRAFICAYLSHFQPIECSPVHMIFVRSPAALSTRFLCGARSICLTSVLMHARLGLFLCHPWAKNGPF